MGHDRLAFPRERSADLRRRIQSYRGAGDAGQLRCSDGASAAFRFQRLSLRRGYGAGSSGNSLSFTYGLSAEDSAPYLTLPAGKELSGSGKDLELVAAVPFPPR